MSDVTRVSVETPTPAGRVAAPAASPPSEPPAPESPAATGGPPPAKRDIGNLLFGQKLRTDQEIHERLGNSTALAVFASDALSSVAYATEEMLKVMLPVVAAAAFGALLPLSLGIVLLLVALVFSYRQTIKAYPSAGGAYIVTKDNFGLLAAQLAGVALLTDYVLTVAVSVSAGVSAIIAAVPALHEFRVPMCLFFIALRCCSPPES